MLINTVVLFLRDTLPVFLLVSFLLAFSDTTRLWLSSRLVAIAVLAYVTHLWLDDISQLADGAGFELLKSLLLFTAWTGLCLTGWKLAINAPLPAFGMTLLLAGISLPNTLHFMVYFLSELSRSNDNTLLLLGTTIGLGICVSISILLNIGLTCFVSTKVTYFLLCIFVAAQVANVAILLEQTDVFPTPQQLWDSSTVVSDNSEYGHLLNAFLGYEATPSLSYLLMFVIAAIAPALLTALFSKRAALTKEISQ
ncbi:FTR1 family iron permease [Aestuariibacter sp. A3R04]|uniref:FTR1 family iron permease n=1 Tax=Aestuariibacter sp. A3R04 TaxID=2841571 RepID=UPI001C08A0AD|nr:FTR1 family iron permease [Aestuariibacter sp. A3R04]MBU3022031.1 FTR1 family iron permease [Aestuariibacter sp. A3R04]